jgi:hypothetical protein
LAGLCVGWVFKVLGNELDQGPVGTFFRVIGTLAVPEAGHFVHVREDRVGSVLRPKQLANEQCRNERRNSFSHRFMLERMNAGGSSVCIARFFHHSKNIQIFWIGILEMGKIMPVLTNECEGHS